MEASKSGPGGIRTGAAASEHVLGIPTSHGPTPRRAGRTPHRVGVSRSPAESPRQPGKAFGDVRAGTGVRRRLDTVSWIVTHTKTKESELPGDRGCGVGRPTPGAGGHHPVLSRSRGRSLHFLFLAGKRGPLRGSAPPGASSWVRLTEYRWAGCTEAAFLLLKCVRDGPSSLSRRPQTPAGSHLRSHPRWGGGTGSSVIFVFCY